MDDINGPESLTDCQLDLNRDVMDWLTALQKADQTFSNIMTLELWSIAKTMDELRPGFWALYMENRQKIVRQQLEERRYPDNKPSQPRPRRIAPRQPSPINLSLTPPNDAPSVERVSIFSEELVRELPKLKRTVLQPLEPLTTEEEPAAMELPLEESEKPSLPFVPHYHYPPDLEPIEIVAPTSYPPDSPFLPEDTLFRDTTPFTKLPHLIRSPELKILPSPSGNGSDQGMVSVILTCWLTRHFLIPVTEAGQTLYQLKRFNQMMLHPGQSVLCRLGFEWNAIPLTTRVRLGKSLKAHQGLTATWGTASNRLRYEISDDLKSEEASVTLSNYSNQPFTLQVGQPFCRLEFACPIAHLPVSRWEDHKKPPLN